MTSAVPHTPETIASELQQALSAQTVIRVSEPLAKRTTLRVGGPADVLVEPGTEEDLIELLRYCSAHEIPWMPLGRGSNLLVKDGGIRGIVISLKHPFFSKIQIEGDRIFCGAGAASRPIAYEAKNAGLSGLEFLEGIPGSLGGALRMNAGAMGSAIFQHVQSVRFATPEGEIVELPVEAIPVEYRNCPLLHKNIALSAFLLAQPAPKEIINDRMSECSRKRWGTQPAAPSAGCIFKNSPTIPSGKLVQELGLKGKRIGGAVISDVHGNFIVNDQNASARDVLNLIDLVKQQARADRGIDLHTEVQIVGED